MEAAILSDMGGAQDTTYWDCDCH